MALAAFAVHGADKLPISEDPSMNPETRILVVYYSHTGNTERVAKDLAARLRADVERIEDKADRSGFTGYLGAIYDSVRKVAADIGKPQKDPADYALAVVGTPVWAWNITPAARAYLQATKGRPRAVAFFVTSGNTDAAKIVPEMEAVSGQKAIASTGFTANELKDPAAYESKLGAFVKALEARP